MWQTQEHPWVKNTSESLVRRDVSRHIRALSLSLSTSSKRVVRPITFMLKPDFLGAARLVLSGELFSDELAPSGTKPFWRGASADASGCHVEWPSSSPFPAAGELILSGGEATAVWAMAPLSLGWS